MKLRLRSILNPCEPCCMADWLTTSEQHEVEISKGDGVFWHYYSVARARQSIIGEIARFLIVIFLAGFGLIIYSMFV